MPLFWFISYFFSTYTHSITFTQCRTIICRHSPRFLSISSSQVRKNLPGVPSWESSSGLPYSKPTHYRLSYAAHYFELRRSTYLKKCLNFSKTPICCRVLREKNVSTLQLVQLVIPWPILCSTRKSTACTVRTWGQPKPSPWRRGRANSRLPSPSPQAWNIPC